jgi:hypothetical protein
MLKSIVNAISSIGKSIDGATFLKEDESVDILLSEMETLKKDMSDQATIEAITQDMMLIKYGQVGEKNVAYELRNSFIPMYILHGITIEHEDYKAQLDFVLITNKFICILETKKLNGEITITNDGDFIRHFKNRNGKTIKKEGMYSPIAQNQRHVRIVKDMLIKAKIIKSMPVLSLVVVANPKSIINHKYATREIKDQIVKHDQLTPRIKKMIKSTGEGEAYIVTMQQIASFFIENHVEQENAFIRKYKGVITEENAVVEQVDIKQKTELNIVRIEEDTEQSDSTSKEMIKEKLIKFRLDQSRKEQIKAYLIFNNKQLDDILERMPKTGDELMACEGFGKVKVEKYGKFILKIIHN